MDSVPQKSCFLKGMMLPAARLSTPASVGSGVGSEAGVGLVCCGNQKPAIRGSPQPLAVFSQAGPKALCLAGEAGCCRPSRGTSGAGGWGQVHTPLGTRPGSPEAWPEWRGDCSPRLQCPPTLVLIRGAQTASDASVATQAPQSRLLPCVPGPALSPPWRAPDPRSGPSLLGSCAETMGRGRWAGLPGRG